MIQSIVNFLAGLHPAVYAVIGIVVTGTVFYIQHKDDSKVEFIKAAREELYKLFLLAEKQSWIGEKKMEFVVEQMYIKYVPTNLEKLIPEETVEEWVLNQYKGFKEWLASEKLENLIAPKEQQ